VWPFVEGGKGKEEKNNGKGGTIEKGLQCPEFMTWKVGNPNIGVHSYQSGLHIAPDYYVKDGNYGNL